MGQRVVPIIGVMGGGRTSAKVAQLAYELGAAIAGKGWRLLNGGRAAGVMEYSARGAHEAGGQVIGILPTDDRSGMSQYVDIPIVTGMRDARNLINVLTSDVVVALPGGAGTLSEIMLALKNERPTVLLGYSQEQVEGLLADQLKSGALQLAKDLSEALRLIEKQLG